MGSDSLSSETRRVSELRIENPTLKTHTGAQIEALIASIRAFGFNDPIGIDENNVILEGQARLEAAQHMGMDEVPVIVVSGLTPQERAAYAIAHNQTSMNTGMDREAVRSEFDALGVQESDFVSMGYTPDDVLFMSTDFDYQPGAAAVDHNGNEKLYNKAFLPTILSNQLRFDNESQSVQFREFMSVLRTQYPDAQINPERLLAFVAEYEGIIA